MYESPDASEHPLLEGQYIGFVRVECDGEDEKKTPFLVQLISGRVKTIFSVEQPIEWIDRDEVNDRFQACLRKHNIGEIVTPSYIPHKTGFLGVSSFINLDDALSIGSRNPDPESPHFEGDEIINWVAYETLWSLESTDCDYLLQEIGVQVKIYDVEEKKFIRENDV